MSIKRPWAWSCLLLLVLTASLGTGLYQGRRLGRQSEEVERLGRQRQALAEQRRQLEREHEQATHLLAELRDENARLRSGQMLLELLRLRGQAKTLQQELAVAQAQIPPNQLGGMVRDPALKRDMVEQLRRNIRLVSADLFRELKLTPAQVETTVQLVTDWFLKKMETLASVTPGTRSQAELTQLEASSYAELWQQLQLVVGEQAIARFQQELEASPAHDTVDLLNQHLGARQLSGEQTTRLLEVVKAEPFNLTKDIGGWLDQAFLGTPEDIQGHVGQIEASNAHILQQANSFLSPEQCAVLSQVLSNGINARIAYAAAYIQKQ